MPDAIFASVATVKIENIVIAQKTNMKGADLPPIEIILRYRQYSEDTKV